MQNQHIFAYVSIFLSKFDRNLIKNDLFSNRYY